MKQKQKDEKGQATVEIALLLPVLAIFLLLIIQVSVVVRQHMLVSHASREAARVLSVENNNQRAIDTAHKSVPGAKVKISRPMTSGEFLTVNVSEVVPSPIPIIGRALPSITVSSDSVMRVEK